MYLRFGEPLDTSTPARSSAAKWEATVKQRTQDALETALADLQQLRGADPYRTLNPLRRRVAVQPTRTPASNGVPRPA